MIGINDCSVTFASGKACYYFDANGRYEKKETLLRFVDHLKRIGAYDQTVIVEEPFDELNEIDVHDIPLRLVADVPNGGIFAPLPRYEEMW